MDSSCNLGVSTLRFFFACSWFGSLVYELAWYLWYDHLKSVSNPPLAGVLTHLREIQTQPKSAVILLRDFFSENIAASFVVFRHTMAPPSKPTQPAHPPVFSDHLFFGGPKPSSNNSGRFPAWTKGLKSLEAHWGKTSQQQPSYLRDFIYETLPRILAHDHQDHDIFSRSSRI